LRIDGRLPPHAYAPHVAHRLGLAFVHQELGNFPILSVAENVALGASYPRRLGLFVAQNELHRRVRAVFDELDARIRPGAQVTELTAVEQRLVMVARALYHDARVLFLDEPSVSLTIEEIRHLHAIVRRLKERGHSIVYVSHRLNEIVSLTDRVVVMQDGVVTLEKPTQQVGEGELIDAIAGIGVARVATPSPPARPAGAGTPRLRLRALNRPPLVRDVSFDLHAGEILGLAGLVGSGRTEVVRMIFGADAPARGTIELDGARVRLRSPVDAIRRGIALLPEDRRHEGLVLDFTARENITLASLSRYRHARFLPVPSRRRERAAAAAVATRLAIPASALERQARRLSGGTQQKVVLAKWLQRGGKVVIFDEPTQGVDVEAKEELFALVRGLAEEGRGVIVISSDFAELARLCTRVVVLREGQVSGVLERHDISEDALVRLAYAAAGTSVAEVSVGAVSPT
jgi:ABC-type sugar transport system ATPase subunit